MMPQCFPLSIFSCMDCFVGDARDPKRFNLVFQGVNCIIRAATLKRAPTREYNPFQKTKTNITGAENLIRGVVRNKVEKAVAPSTERAAGPVNSYGVTKPRFSIQSMHATLKTLFGGREQAGELLAGFDFTRCATYVVAAPEVQNSKRYDMLERF